MDYFGLNLTNNALQIAQVKKSGVNFTLTVLEEVVNNFGLDFANERNRKNLLPELNKLLALGNIKTKQVVVGIPEKMVISRLVVLPPMKEEEIASALRYEADTFIPYPVTEAQMDYQVVKKMDNGQQYVWVVATRKSFLDGLQQLLTLADLVPLAVENEGIALTRALVPARAKPTLIFDIKQQETLFLVVKDAVPYLSRIVPVGSQAFTRAVSVALGMDNLKAQEYKNVYGFEKGKWQNKVRKALLPLLTRLIEDARQTMVAFNEEWHETVDLIILSGQESALPKLSDELIRTIGIEVQMGAPMANMQLAETIDKNFLKRKLDFSAAIGLAERQWR